MRLPNDSLALNTTEPPSKLRPAGSVTDFYIGLGLAMSSSLFIGTSYIFKKKALNRLANIGVRAGDGGHGYLKDWMWWSGLILMGSGEGANFAAYAFAPATMVTPLGTLSVLVTAVLSSRFLGESLNLLGKTGCLLTITGSTMIVLHSPKEQEIQSLAELSQKLTDPGFIIYASLVLAVNLFLIVYCAPRWGYKNPLVYLTITGTIGSLSVMACKGMGVAIKETARGHNQFGNWLTWTMVVCVAFFITVQMNYLNKALDVFNASVVTPILYVFFTSFVIIASAILFKEWMNMSGEDYLGILAGFVTIVAGIFLLNAFKEMSISLATLNVRVHREVSAAGAAGGGSADGPRSVEVNGGLGGSGGGGGSYRNGPTSFTVRGGGRSSGPRGADDDEARVKLLEEMDSGDEYDTLHRPDAT